MSDKPSAAWYLAPIFLGIVGSAIMWFVLKDEDHPDSPKMVKKGWIIGIILTLISFAWIPFVMIPVMFMGGFDQQNMMQPITEHVEEMMTESIPEHVERMLTEPIQQQVPAPGFEDVPEMIVESEISCDPSYPDVCITPWPPDLDCGEIQFSNFKVLPDDPHGFDADNDGIGCEVGSPQSPNPVDTTPSCDPSYPDVCIAPYPPDLNCGDIGYSNFRVIGDDPHGFDRDNDGIGCES